MQASHTRVDEFAWHAPLFIHSELLEDLRSLGPLLHEDVATMPNTHDPNQLEEFRTLVFDGLELYGWVAPAGSFKPIRAVVTNSRWRIGDGLDVGTTAARIETVLGPLTEVSDSVFRYEGETERVNFHVHGDEPEPSGPRWRADSPATTRICPVTARHWQPATESRNVPKRPVTSRENRDGLGSRTTPARLTGGCYDRREPE
jgi:hypothetical protein